MKTFCPHTLRRLVLAAGTLAGLTALPHSATAQLVGGFRSGSVSSGAAQAAPRQSYSAPVQSRPVQVMRSGAIERGAGPISRREIVPSSGQVFDRAPIYSRRPGYGRGSSTTYSNTYSGSGPVVSLPEYPSNNGYAFGNGQYGNGAYGGVYLPPVGPGNGYFRNPIPPVGPANGYFSGQAPITGGQPPLLGGYYYGNYCPPGHWRHSYPSVYSGYSGFPESIYSTNIVVVEAPYTPVYETPYLPFAAPVYQTTYNQNNYYVATPERVSELQAGGTRRKRL